MNNGFLQYKIFEPYKNLVAFTTTKQLKGAKTPRFTPESEREIWDNRRLLAGNLKISPGQLLFPRQTHSANVLVIDDFPTKELDDTDALITNRKSICICVQTADCVPVFLFDPLKEVVAIVHSGWRGTVQKIAGKTVEAMVSRFGISPQNILAAIGPSIGPDVYEVGDEVVNKVCNSFDVTGNLISKHTTGKYHFNLWEANRQILTDKGVSPDNIEIAGECSFLLNEKYYSARKEGVETGRMVSGIMLK